MVVSNPANPGASSRQAAYYNLVNLVTGTYIALLDAFFGIMVASGTWALVVLAGASHAVARSFWSSSPATYGSKDKDSYLLKTGYPIGNGRLGGKD